MSTDKPKKTTKMFGYLEKRGKMTITGRWRRLWCVLEGPLLLYYKSEAEYSKLSPCDGSLNIALAKSIQPLNQCKLRILTHSKEILLKTSSKEKQVSWFHALVSVLPQNSYPDLKENTSTKKRDSKRKSKRYGKYEIRRSMKNNTFENRQKWNPELIHQFHDDLELTNSEEKFEVTSTSDYRNQALTGAGDNTETPFVCELNNTIFKEIQNKKFLPIEITDLNSSKSFSNINPKRIMHLNNTKINTNSSDQHLNHKYIVTEKQKSDIERSISCDCLQLSVYERQCDTTKIYNKQHANEKNFVNNEINRLQTNEHKQTVHKFYPFFSKTNKTCHISRQFFKNIWQKRKSHKIEKTASSNFINTQYLCDNFNQDEEIRTQSSRQNSCDHSKQDTEVDKKFLCTAETVTLTQINNFNVTEETEADSNKPESITDNILECTTKTNESVEIEESQSLEWIQGQDYLKKEAPELPAKEIVNSDEYRNKIAELNFDPYGTVGRANKQEHSSTSSDLDEMLIQLHILNCENTTIQLTEHEKTKNEDEDPDYDFPISLASFIKNNPEYSANEDENRNNSNNESTYSKCTNSLSLDMIPDSLEMVHTTPPLYKCINDWSTDEYHFPSDSDTESEDRYVYHDSLNTPTICS